MKLAALALALAALIGAAAGGREHRSRAVLRDFEWSHPCPTTGLGYGP